MTKVNWKPGTMIYPLPAVLVSCGKVSENPGLITIAWTGTINSKPPMCYISVRKERYSYGLIRSGMDFVINLTTEHMLGATDWCGVRSGRDYDKFKETGLTPVESEVVTACSVKESPVNIECRVKDVIELGSHDMFISEVVHVKADSKYIDSQGAFNLNRAGMLAYSHGHYHRLGPRIGKFGFSVRKKKKRKKNKPD